MRVLIPAVLVVTLAALAGAAGAVPWTEMSDDDLAKELRLVNRELESFRSDQSKLERAGRASSNASRTSALDDIEKTMIGIVYRREDMLSVDHTIIRHGEPVSGPTAAAEVGTPNANKETRRRMDKGTSGKSDDFLRLAWMQQQIIACGRIYQPAAEKQSGAFENYLSYVAEFGGVLQSESDGITAELSRREAAAAAAAAEGGAGDD